MNTTEQVISAIILAGLSFAYIIWQLIQPIY